MKFEKKHALTLIAIAVWNVLTYARFTKALIDRVTYQGKIWAVPQVMDAEPLAAAIDRAYAARRESPRNDTPNDSFDPDRGLLPASELDIGPEPDVEEELRSVLANSDNDLLHVQGKAPMVRLVDLLLFEAVQRQASDIHIQPLSDRTLIRYRLDGVLHTVRELPPRALPPMVGRVKVMARLDVAERGAPQDGRATVTLGRSEGRTSTNSDARRIDLRISTLPTTYGERVVDVFYVKDVFGLKIAHRSKMQRVHKQLADVLAAR